MAELGSPTVRLTIPAKAEYITLVRLALSGLAGGATACAGAHSPSMPWPRGGANVRNVEPGPYVMDVRGAVCPRSREVGARRRVWPGMRVLMTTKSGAGHFGPLVPFARVLRRSGADVVIAAPRQAAPMVRAARLPLWAVDDPPAGERDAIFAAVRHSTQPEAKRIVGDVFARIDARAAYPGVLAACQVWHPDVVISEITEFAGPLAADAIGAPSIAVGISQQRSVRWRRRRRSRWGCRDRRGSRSAAGASESGR